MPILYIFIKVKSNKGKKMAAPKLIGYSHFLLAALLNKLNKFSLL